MFIVNKDQVSRRARAGLVSHILLHKRDDPAANLVVTWVDVAPGARQVAHAHAPQQVYVIVAGEGEMRVGDRVRAVATGDLIFIPPHMTHGIRNSGSEPLSYISAATPAWDVLAVYDEGDLRPEMYR